MIRVKICGINSAEALAAATEERADHIGFVFFARSPRAVTAEKAAAIKATQPSAPPAIGLFVAPTLEEIAAVLAVVALDGLQIYGNAALARAVRREFGQPVWLAQGVATSADLAAAASAASEGLDGLVIEAKPPPGATRPGGNAVAIDWAMLAGWSPTVPWLLAGGLTPDNVAQAIAASETRAVDVSSGVERIPGVKEPELIRAFVRAARSARPSGPHPQEV
jgi:phosphoribosylanthranilate isomerase